jgi:hypothetical protein
MGLVKGARLAAEEPWLPGAGAVLAATDWCDRGNGIRYDGVLPTIRRATVHDSYPSSGDWSPASGEGEVSGTPL